MPRVGPGTRTNSRIFGPDGARLPDKADPLAKATEQPPATASVVANPEPFVWHDEAWMETRAPRQAPTRRSRSTRYTRSWFRPGHGRIAELGRAGRSAGALCVEWASPMSS